MALRIGRSRVPEHLARTRMSQAEFARRIGVSGPMITKIINGEKHFSYLRAKIASDVLGCKMEELVEWVNIPSKGSR